MNQSNTRYFRLSAEQMRRIQPFFPKLRGRARSNDCKVPAASFTSSEMVFDGKMVRAESAAGSRASPNAVHGPYKTVYDRFARWSRMGIFARIFQELARPGA